MPPEQVKWVGQKIIRDMDVIVEDVLAKYLSRSILGQGKYNTTLQNNNSDNYLQHLQEELMDGSLYIQKLLQQKKDITQLVINTPNDQDLGKLIRQIYGSSK